MSEDCAGSRMKRARIETENQPQQPKQFNLLQLNDDVLLVLFLHLTHLSDAFNLGITCRQLYELYQKSLANRRSLLLYREGHSVVKEFGDIFETITAVDLTKTNHCFVRLPTSTVSATFFSNLFVCFSNLVSLELVDMNKYDQSFPFLLTALRSSSQLSGRLQTLKLALNNLEEGKDNDVQQPLELPALKHLTLYLNDVLNPSQETDLSILNTALFHSVLSQLSSFCLFVANRLMDVLEFIDAHVLANDQLVAAVNTPALQIAVDVRFDEFDIEQFAPSFLQGLACITSLYSIHNIEFEIDFLPLLPFLINLMKVRIILCEEEPSTEAEDEWYPRVLAALATLSQLEDISIKTKFDSVTSTGTCRWVKRVMPILPNVRSFSLSFSSTAHVNPVEAFYLAHCFPGLQQLSVSFSQYKCDFCDYRAVDVDVFQKCVLRMATDLMLLGTGTGWQAQVKLKKMKVNFPNRSVKFSSLENLIDGIKDQ